MCGIVGLFIKRPALEARLGALLAPMLVEMSERGPDSAGIAIYRDPVAEGNTKLTVLATQLAAGESYDWRALTAALRAAFGGIAALAEYDNHAVIRLPAPAADCVAWFNREHPELLLTSSGGVIETFKDVGLPAAVLARYGIAGMGGSHALGHTRMATESAVTIAGSHPFSTGDDLCLVHNGSLSNHNDLRRSLQRRGVQFRTENDSEVAAGYLGWRLREGDSLKQALEHGIRDMDGFYTFAVGSRDGFAVLRDPIGCKPAVMAETDDWVAMSSEFRAIATLPGADDARIWEPEPGVIYNWERG